MSLRHGSLKKAMEDTKMDQLFWNPSVDYDFSLSSFEKKKKSKFLLDQDYNWNVKPKMVVVKLI
jgi:hypothetical protein